MGYVILNGKTMRVVRYTESKQIAVYGTKEEIIEDGYPERWIVPEENIVEVLETLLAYQTEMMKLPRVATEAYKESGLEAVEVAKNSLERWSKTINHNKS